MLKGIYNGRTMFISGLLKAFKTQSINTTLGFIGNWNNKHRSRKINFINRYKNNITAETF